MVNLSGNLPKGDSDGLGALSSAMIRDPEATHIIVALVNCKKLTTEIESGETVPTAQIRAVEAFHMDTADAKELRRLWRRQFERRTGQVELPLQIEREIDAITPAESDEDGDR